MIKRKVKNISKVLMISILTLAMVATVSIGQLQTDGAKVYADSHQKSSLANFKEVGDYYFTEVDTKYKVPNTVSLPNINHVAKISGIYRLEIVTPSGGGKGKIYDEANNGGRVSYGEPGQKLDINIKIAKGSKFVTVGNLFEGIGIRGIIQLTGGNGTPGYADSSYYNRSYNGGNGYFGANGGNGTYYYHSDYSSSAHPGAGYIGGLGWNCKVWSNNSGSWHSTVWHKTHPPGKGGDGFIPGKGGKGFTADDIVYYEDGQPGNKYVAPAGVNLINQDETGSIKQLVGGNFPAFTTQESIGTKGSIKLTLIKKEEVDLNEGIVSVTLSKDDAYVEMALNLGRMASAFEKMSEKNGNNGSGSTSTTDIFIVIAGKEFNELIKTSNDQTNGGIAEGVTVLNANKSDGVVRIRGRINEAGSKSILIDGVYYHVKAVKEPDSASITATFD